VLHMCDSHTQKVNHLPLKVYHINYYNTGYALNLIRLHFSVKEVNHT